MSAYDSAALLAQVRRVTYAPTSSTTGTADSDILALATFEMHAGLVPRLRKVREEWFVTSTDLTIQNGVSTYAIPTRSIAGSLRDVWLVMADGSSRYFPREDLSAIPGTYLAVPTASGSPVCFYLQGNNLVLFPAPGATNLGTLRLFYEFRPNDLCAVSAAGIVSSVNTTTGVVTLTGAVPSGITTSTPCDLVNGNPHFETKAFSLTPTAVSGSTVTFTPASLPATLAAGDYVTLAGQAPVAQLPYELHPVLEQRTVAKVLEALGDIQKAGLAMAKAQELEDAAFINLTPRVSGKPKRVINRTWM